MSVIVKTMKMPDCCASCPLLEYDEFAVDGYKDHWCNALDIGMSIDELPEGRREDCPLTELIQCKDCKYRDEETANCTRFRKDWYVQSNSFCSWAERKPPQVNPEMVREMKERLEKYKND